MRHATAVLSTTVLTAVFFGASPAAGQNAPVTDPNATGQQQPADPSQPPGAASSAGTPTASGQEIVVTGLRRSLQSARNIKRNSTQVIDAVVAEDIGKLPDITVSDTAARIPGIQVERSGGEASRVLLRGLDNTYYTTTYNGREIFTAETRSVALQDFPAGAIQAIEAFKTSTANLVEPGLAGLINVRSRRPFDFSGFEVNGSVWANYPKQSRDVKPNAQLMLTDRWDVGGGEIGALINFSYTRLHYQDSTRRHGFFIADLAGHRSPDWPEISYGEGDRWRPSINGAIQWRSGNLELYGEGLWQGYREEVSDHYFEQPLWSCGGAATYSNLVVDDQGHIVSGSVLNSGCLGTARGFQGATKRRTNTYQLAVGGKYDAGPLVITGDLARTTSTFKLRAESVDYYINKTGYTVNWFTGEPGGSGPTFQVEGVDFTDPANYNYRGFFERYEEAKGKDWQGRLDAEYAPAALEWLPKIQVGMRYTDRDASRTDAERYWDANDVGRFNIPISAVPLDYELFNSAFHGDSHKPFPITWLAPTFNSVWDNLEALRAFNVANGIPLDPNPNRSQNNDTNPPAVIPARSFDINEKTLAGYAQANFKFGTGEMFVDGTLGIRGVRTKDNINGARLQPGNPVEPITVDNKYTTWLPNLNLNFHFNPQVQLRLAATKTITRPLYEQLNPALSLSTPPPPNCDPTVTSCVITGSGGNPFLKPLKSNNYDVSLEYYFSHTGFASVAAFRRDMRGFIVNRTFEYPTPDPDTGFPIEITGPVNTNKGRIQGWEAQVTTFFDWDWVPTWARSFGAQANVTYIDPKIDLPLFCPGDVTPCVPGPGHGNATQIRTRIPDVSKWTYNLVGMYENGPITARLSYNHRSSYPEGPINERGNIVLDPTVFTLQGHGNPHGRLDWSSSYNVTDNFTVFFDWTNILNNPFKSDIVRVNYTNGLGGPEEIFPMVVRYEESVISGGVRFRFGAPKAAPPPPPAPLPPPPPPPPPATQTCPDGSVVEATATCPAPPPPPPPPPVERGERGE